MARPREFDEDAVLEAAVSCFWSRGFENTTVRHLIEATGLSGASLYNAFGDKRALYEKSLAYYVESSIGDRIRRCGSLAPLAAIEEFFGEILRRSLEDPDCRGCMLVNAALDADPRDGELRDAIAQVLRRIEGFFRDSVRRGQAEGGISTANSPDDLARHLLSVLLGVRVMARIRPEAPLLEGAIGTARTLLQPGDSQRFGKPARAAGGGSATARPSPVKTRE